MANRYWVGNGGNWSDDNHWSTSSGGASGAAHPTNANLHKAIFDGNSFSSASQTVSIGTGAMCGGLVTTGVTNAPMITTTSLGSALVCEGDSFTLVDGMTLDSGRIEIDVQKCVTGNSVTLSGSVPYALYIATTANTQIFPAFNDTSITTTTYFRFLNNVAGFFPTIDLSSKTITCGDGVTPTDYMFQTGSHIGNINLTGTTINCYGSFTIENSDGLQSMTTTGSTINMLTSGANLLCGYNGETWNIINLQATTASVDGPVTISSLIVSPGSTVSFWEAITYTLGDFTANGTSGSPIVLNSITPGSAFTFSKTSGTVSVTYCTITDSTATGGATWLASTANGNIDGGGNTGWSFAGYTVEPMYHVGTDGLTKYFVS